LYFRFIELQIGNAVTVMLVRFVLAETPKMIYRTNLVYGKIRINILGPCS